MRRNCDLNLAIQCSSTGGNPIQTVIETAILSNLFSGFEWQILKLLWIDEPRHFYCNLVKHNNDNTSEVPNRLFTAAICNSGCLEFKATEHVSSYTE